MSTADRDLNIPPESNDAEPPEALILGIDIEEIYQTFAELPAAWLATAARSGELRLLDRKVRRAVTTLLEMGVSALVAESLERAAAFRPDQPGFDEPLMETGLSLDRVMYEIREQLPDGSAAWYDVGVMVARVQMCHTMIVDAGHLPEVADLYRRELSRALPITAHMLTVALRDAGDGLGHRIAAALEELLVVCAEEDPDSAGLPPALTEVFAALGAVERNLGGLPEPPDPESDDGANPGEDAESRHGSETETWWRDVGAQRQTALSLAKEDRLEEADEAFTALLLDLRTNLFLAHPLCMEIQLDRCWVLAKLGKTDLAVDTAHDVACGVEYLHDPADLDAIDLQLRALRFLEEVGARPEADLIRTEYLGWLADASPDALEPPLRAARERLLDLTGAAARRESAAARRAELKALPIAQRVSGLKRLHAELVRAQGPGHSVTLTIAYDLAMARLAAGQERRAARVARAALTACDRAHGPDAPLSVLTAVWVWFVLMSSTTLGPRLLALNERIRWLADADPDTLTGDLREAWKMYTGLLRVIDGQASPE
ncbi:hypothetical protein F8568_032385 [Actinomadura sp. LD22]|uniref:Tetratricopeptide repeat protein n=1 Tax=Actinomadura physcomitrii TaxID=2650748 RepID=A0A6I4MLH0_9ACTN|nr:hypothetical protein [Actinomadura physcomitrii]MWA04984.1 hypothetical protein [Actinomadura physcomitrii]